MKLSAYSCRTFLSVLFLLFVSPIALQCQTAQINKSAFIESNGTKLYLELRGTSRKAPILLYLHGGPGNAFALVSFRAYVGPQLETKFLVAYLHQRGVLNSPAVPDASQTTANYVADVQNVVKYLRTQYPSRRLYLLGHSWGGTLAMLSILDKPNLVDGVIDAAGPFNTQTSLTASYEMALKWARDEHRLDAVKELEALGPPPYHNIDQQITLSKWAASAYGGIDQHLSEARIFSRAPYTKPEANWQDVQISISKAMYAELGQVNVEPHLSRLRTPLLVIVGNLDAVVPPFSLRSGYAAYGGRKRWIDLKQSHHLPFVDEPAQFIEAIRSFIR
ncbi:MAG: alpha/beta hydrolase [Acidobacteria bacterium]|nr:alpha/beta hydrolase [Acidobacteriota bacterium]